MKEKRSQKKGKKISILDSTTKLVSLGNLNLKLSLALSNEFLHANSIDFDDIVSINDLGFLKNNKNLWNDIILSSNNKSMNILIQMNRATKKRFFLEYVTLDTIMYSKEQESFKDFINHVTETNFVFLRESQACACNIDIVLFLSNGSKNKSFKLCESRNLPVKSQNEDKNGEEEAKEKKEKSNLQTNESPDNQKESNKEIEAKEPHKETNPQPPQSQHPPEEENKEENNKQDDDNPFTKITEVSFEAFNYLFLDLGDFTQTEIATSIKLTDIMKFVQYLKINTKIQIITHFPNLLSGSLNTEDMTAIDQLLILSDIYLFERKEAYHIFNVLHLYTSQEQNPKDLDKKKDIQYFINEVCYQCPIKYKEKIGIFIEDFTKVIIVSLNPNSKPTINEYDALIYPKINHHNMKVVDEYKQLVNQNYAVYCAIFFGSFIGKLIQGEVSDKKIYASYLIAIESTKKILELNKNRIDLPKNKDFYRVKLPGDKIEEELQNQLLRQKEGKFILDCVNEQRSRLKYYNPLFDFHLHTYFSSQNTKKELKTKGFINSKGFIMYDSVYRQMRGSSQEEIRKKNPPLHQKVPSKEYDKNNLYGRSKQLPPIKGISKGNSKAKQQETTQGGVFSSN